MEIMGFQDLECDVFRWAHADFEREKCRFLENNLHSVLIC